MLLIFLEKLAMVGFPDMNLGVLVIRGAEVLAVTGDGCCYFQESSGLLLEHHFLAPVQIPHLHDTDPSSCWYRHFSFHNWLLGFPSVDL